MQLNMAHDTQSIQNIKDSESDNSIGRQINGNGSSTSRSSMSDTPVLRRSSRESSLKKNNSRKSVQREKPIPQTTPAKNKSEKVENKSTPSPLRRSERGKSHSSTSASEPLLTNDESEKKEENTLGHGQVKKLLNSRAYIARFLRHAGFVPKQHDKLTPQLCYNTITEDIGNVSERVHVDGTSLKAPEVTISTSNGRISDVHDGLEGSDRITVSNRKRKIADSGPDDSGENASKDICSVVGTSSALPSGCTGDVPAETCGICFKRQRVDQDPMQQESCPCGVNKVNRKRGKHTDEQSKKPQVESDEAAKRQKVGFSNRDLASLKPGFEGKSTPVFDSGASVTRRDCVPCSFSSISAFLNKKKIAILQIDNSEEKRKQLDAQKSLHLHMKPEISKLCGILQFSDIHKDWVEKFLEYLMKNHYVIRESATTQQAFQISVCWTVASILKHKIDHKVSFLLAKQHLNFNCQKEEADRVYAMLRCLKKVFLYRTGNFKAAADSPNFSDSNNGTTPNLQGFKSVEDYWIYLVKKDLSKCINEIQVKFEKKVKKLVLNQYEERSRILKFIDLEKEKLEMKHKIELAVNRFTSASADRLKIIKTEFEKETEELHHRAKIQLHYLEKLQLEARVKLKDKEDQHIEELQTWVYDELWNRSPPNAPDKILACYSPVKTVTTPTGLSMSNGPLVPVHSDIYDFSEKDTNCISGDNHLNVASEIPCAKELMTSEGGSSVNAKALPDVLRLCSSKVVTSGLPSFDERIDKSDKLPICDRDANAEDLVIVSPTDGPVTHSDAEQCPHGAALNMPNRETPLEPHETVSLIHDVNDVGSVSLCGSEEHHRLVTVNIPDNEVESAVIATVRSSDAVGNFHSEVPPSAEQVIAGSLTGIVNNEVFVTAPDVATRFDQQEGVVTEFSSSAQVVATIESEQSHHELTTNMPGGPSSVTPNPSPRVSSPSGVPEIQPSRVSSIQDVVLATLYTGREGNAQACENTCQPVENLASQNVMIRASDHVDSNINEISLSCAPEHQRIENQDTSILLATSTAIQDGDGRGNGDQVTCQPLENPVSQSAVIVEYDHEVLTTTTLSSLQLPLEDTSVILATSVTIEDGVGQGTGNQITCQPVENPESQSVIVESDREVPATATLASLQLPPEDTSVILATSSTIHDGDGRGTGNQITCQPVENPESQSVVIVESDHEVPTTASLPSLQLPPGDSSILFDTSATIQDGDGDGQGTGNQITCQPVENPESQSVFIVESGHEVPTTASLPSPQLLLEDSSILLDTSVTIQDGRGTGNQITCQPVENPESQSGVIIESDLEVPTTASLPSLQPLLEDSSIILATSVTIQDGDGRGTGNHITCQPVENPTSQSVAFVESDPEVPTNTSLTSLQLPLESAAGGIEIQPRREDHTSNQISQDPVQLVSTYSDRSTETPLQYAASPLHRPINIPQPISIHTNGSVLPFSGIHTASVSNNHNIHAAPQETLRVPHYSYPDPLQNELERLTKEIEQNIKLHEDNKLRVKSDFDRKIEEAVAELHRQCEAILQKEEAEFQHKQKELDANHDKVLMNKILAEAFRSKCMDFRASSAFGVQQGRNSSFVQQLGQLSVQQNTQRASSVSSLSSTSLPASSVQTSGALSLQMTPPASVAPSQHYIAPIMHTVPLSPASLSIPVRPPHIGTLSGPTGISQGRSQIRSPAPHLQPIRPSSSVSETTRLSQQGGMSNPLSSLPATSPSTPHIPRMRAPTQKTVPSSSVEHASSGRRDMEQHPGANQRGGLSSLPALDSFNYPGPIYINSAAANPVNTGAVPEVVCLSDDD